jgi:CDP-4-dehydro-6-deoxyglucose reductase, E3
MPNSVTLARSGRKFECRADETVLEAATREGILIPYGCRNGACGSCRARLTAGKVQYLSGEPPGLDARQRARGEVLLCQARPTDDVTLDVEELDAARITQVRTLPVRVMRLDRVAHDVMRMGLKLPASERLQYMAGQYVEILMRDGRRRAFSLANPPHQDDELELHVRLVPGGAFSGHVFDGMRERALLRIHGPLGGFFLREESQRPIVFVAGGTGLAPIKAMIEGAIHAGDERPMTLYWGVRAGQDLYAHQQAQSWAKLANITYVPVLSDPQPDDEWNGRTGFVHQAVADDFPDASDLDVYASGPPVMVRALSEVLEERGLELDRLFYDSFDYAFETGYDG